MYRLLYIPEAKYVDGVSRNKKEELEYFFTIDISFAVPGDNFYMLNLKENKNLFEIVEVADYV